MDKQQFMVQVWKQLELLRVGLDKLRMLAMQADDKLRGLYHANVTVLQSKFTALKVGALELEKASDDAWPKLSSSVEKASQDLDRSLAQALREKQEAA